VKKEWEEGDSEYIFSQVPASTNWLRQTEVKGGESGRLKQALERTARITSSVILGYLCRCDRKLICESCQTEYWVFSLTHSDILLFI